MHQETAERSLMTPGSYCITAGSVDYEWGSDMPVQELQALGEAVGTVSRGVPQDIIDALPNAKYTGRFSDAHPSDGKGPPDTATLIAVCCRNS